MNLHTLRLVAFSILMQTGAGIADKEPETIWTTFNAIQAAESLSDLRKLLPKGLQHQLDNYLSVWGPTEAAPAAPALAPTEAAAETITIKPTDVVDIREVLDVSDRSA